MWLAGAWVAGTAVGLSWGRASVWLLCAGVGLIGAGVMGWRGRARGVRSWCRIAAVALAAGWSALMVRYVPGDHISRHLSEQGAAVRVRGTVISEPRLRGPQGIFGALSRQGVATHFLLELKSIEIDAAIAPVAGRVLARVGGAGTRLSPGAVVEAEGWLRPLARPGNPGEFDAAKWWARQGVEANLSIERMENLRILKQDAPSRLWRLRQVLAGAAAQSLRAGLSGEPDQAGALLEAVLLGERGARAQELYEPFQRTGLIHLLSISGAHLAVLLGLAWLIARLTLPHPTASALVVLAVLALYLLVVPAEVPIIRSGIMAAGFCVAYASGRRVTSLQALAAAAMVVLVLWPAELESPGFQLSFGIVAGFLVFVTPVQKWLLGDSDLLEGVASSRSAVVRWGAGWLAVNIVAFLVALPIVAYHFRLVSLGSIPVAILGAPLVTAVLALGYLKIVVGLVLPSAGLLLAGPLHATAAALVWAVDWAATIPGIALQLVGPPSLAWTLAGLALVVALFRGSFRGRWPALLTVTALWVGWALATDLDRVVVPRLSPPSVTVDMLSVGDGSCYVLRARDPKLGEAAYVFDAGSQDRLDVGARVAAPALRALGVRRLEAVFISHADLDHFCGVPDLLDAVPVRRVVLTPQVLQQAEDAGGAAAVLIQALRQRRVHVQTVEAGWCERWGAVALEAIWPIAGLEKVASNDSSLVLAARVGDRRLILWGDLQQVGIKRLLASGGDVRADVCDLPHHGSFVPASPVWIKAVGPKVVLQSCGPQRLLNDPWPQVLNVGTQRLVTAQSGAAEVTLTAKGLKVRGFSR